jgi:hypothetical protein
MSEVSPIDLGPVPRRRPHHLGHDLRRIAAWVHLSTALAIVLAVFAQLYLIGAYIFRAGEEALTARETIGWSQLPGDRDARYTHPSAPLPHTCTSTGRRSILPWRSPPTSASNR